MEHKQKLEGALFTYIHTEKHHGPHGPMVPKPAMGGRRRCGGGRIRSPSELIIKCGGHTWNLNDTCSAT